MLDAKAAAAETPQLPSRALIQSGSADHDKLERSSIPANAGHTCRRTSGPLPYLHKSAVPSS